MIVGLVKKAQTVLLLMEPDSFSRTTRQITLKHKRVINKNHMHSIMTIVMIIILVVKNLL